MTTLTCPRPACGYTWVPRVERPVACPACRRRL